MVGYAMRHGGNGVTTAHSLSRARLTQCSQVSRRFCPDGVAFKGDKRQISNLEGNSTNVYVWGCCDAGSRLVRQAEG